MVQCKNCGTQLPDNAAFCSRCGAPQAPAKKVCPACGTEASAEQFFCEKCGTRLPAPAPRPAPMPQPVPPAPQPVQVRPPVQPYAPAPAPVRQQPPYLAPGQPVRPQTVGVSTGGLMAYAVICLLLLCMPAGIVALVYATRANNAATTQEAQALVKKGYVACNVGLVVGIVLFLLMIVLIAAS